VEHFCAQGLLVKLDGAFGIAKDKVGSDGMESIGYGFHFIGHKTSSGTKV
jgi:hypothetical protein